MFPLLWPKDFRLWPQRTKPDTDAETSIRSEVISDLD